MAENKHVFLRNEASKNDGFKKTRNVQGDSSDEQEVEPSKFPNPSQQDRLRRANAILFAERKVRNEKRTIEVPATIELIVIRFYKVVNENLRKVFYEKYGLLVSSYEDFNKTVLFEIVEHQAFKVFLNHLELFYESPQGESYQGKDYNVIALIHDFRFLSSGRRIKSVAGGLSALSLISGQTQASNIIFESLQRYLQERNKPVYYTELSPEVIEVGDLTREDIVEIADNFDIVKAVTSTRTERRRPGAYGEERRGYGFTVTVADNLPIVGVIDTGFYRIEPLRPALTSISYDLTGNGAYWDESGHGTAVASLTVLGHEFITEIKESYEAKARLAVIKAIQNDHDNINIVELSEVIRRAKIEHNIRIFNLSLNDPLPKGYNKSFGDYAYLLDKLSYESDILIFISVGNISESRLRELIDDEPHASHEYPTIFYSPDGGSDIHRCETTNLCEPSESLNNISIGALAGNLEAGTTSDITPSEIYPAYFSRKFHYDYEQPINGAEFMRSQKNKHLNKPDLVFEGGDLFQYESGMEILRSPIEPDGSRYFSRSCGTSLATPLITSLAATILKEYPSLKTQSVKALLINSANSPCGLNPPAFRGFPINLLRKLSGYGRPNSEILVASDNNSITFVIESDIKIDEFQTIPLNLPEYINESGNKLNFKGTLCYSFLPIKDNHLCYLPMQITFGIFKPIEANVMGNLSTEDYRIKTNITWSDDFFGVDNRLFSNVQQINDNISGEKVQSVGNKISIAIKCTCKKDIPESHKNHLEQTSHKFSLALTVTELPASKANNRLYNDIIAINSVEAIAIIVGEAEAEL
jgi:subtilisin family serine protease